ncbi:LCP family protein [Vagococcus coleopterorum]|uniref:Regulatory protein MsrR n=2 Tax=Vagococcus coleopterorum TaxID=2714946 RepID=A0A6G8APV7_9ENTE|nr:LCP family protein [Vagococcus coleopterorum]
MEKYHGKDAEDNNNEEFYEEEQQPKKRKKQSSFKRFIKTIGVILLLVIGFSTFQFIKGNSEAKSDGEFGQIEVTDFNGQNNHDGSTNVLLLGSDSRGTDRGRSDSIMVAHYSKKSRTPKLVSFMRDTYVNIPGYGYNKLNAAYAYGGPELVRQTLKENFNVDVQYYAIVNFASFSRIVDTLLPNGIKIDAEKDLDVDGEDIAKGPQIMDGHKALQYARFRKDEEGDFGRVRRQQQVMNAVFDQGLSVFNAFRLPKAMGKVQGYTSTDVPNRLYATIGKDFIFGVAKPLEKLAVPVEGSWSYGSYEHAGSVLEIDEASNTFAIADFLSN